MAATPHKLPSVDEYLELEEHSSVRHEYIGGMLYAHAGAGRRHNQIVSNLVVLLGTAARGGPCDVFVNDMLLRAAEDVFYYPDVVVVCDPEDTNERFVERPCLVVEVLSPSTQSIDQREKVMTYRRIESLRAYVIVHQDARRVERHWKDGHGAWWHADVSGEGRVPLPCPELELTLGQIYEGVTMSRPAETPGRDRS